jgi:plastocyanin
MTPLVLLALLVAPTATTTTVDAVDNAFRPPTATVAVGDTVTWRNAGTAPHEVSGAAFSSGNLDPGRSYSWTATKAGTYHYVCRYHQSIGMKGTLVVRAAATSHPKTGGDDVTLGLLVLGAAAVAGLTLRYGWSAR